MCIYGPVPCSCHHEFPSTSSVCVHFSSRTNLRALAFMIICRETFTLLRRLWALFLFLPCDCCCCLHILLSTYFLLFTNYTFFLIMSTLSSPKLQLVCGVKEWTLLIYIFFLHLLLMIVHFTITSLLSFNLTSRLVSLRYWSFSSSLVSLIFSVSFLILRPAFIYTSTSFQIPYF